MRNGPSVGTHLARPAVVDQASAAELTGEADLLAEEHGFEPSVFAAAASRVSSSEGKVRGRGWSLWPVPALSAVENDLPTRFGPRRDNKDPAVKYLLIQSSDRLCLLLYRHQRRT